MVMSRFKAARILGCLCLLLGACSSGDDRDSDDADVTEDADSELDDDVDAGSDADLPLDADLDEEGDTDTDSAVIYHDPRAVVPAADLGGQRGLVPLRGIVHAHSVYSHDACDGEPFVGGLRNETCYQQMRSALCETGQDFVFLTDHADLFAEHEFPDVLLWDEGDELIERDGRPVANRLICEDGREVIVAAGSETGTMPIGLERHVGETIESRYAAYDDVSEEGVRALQEAGALVFLQHTEGWPVETILELPIDGIELYNLHQNVMDNMGVLINLLLDLSMQPERVPDVELGLLAFFQESEPDMIRWSASSLLRRTPGILATDVHRNAFSGEAPDGERLDSYRRMMHWFSNVVLVPEGLGVDDSLLKETIAHGRLYGSFDYLGYPQGFDFFATVDDETYEMGDVTPLEREGQLVVTLPSVVDLPPEAPQPEVRGVILRAIPGGWEEVASGEGDLDVTVDAGVYRAEIRVLPRHLTPSLGERTEEFLTEQIWIYSNPIYVALERDLK